jgi:tRNA A37 threonylcarbamoyladenosine dehydratase
MDITRHIDVFSPAALGNCRVDVIGAGAVGSRVVLSLAKLGLTDIHVFDDGLVEPVHVASHLYGIGDVGRSKVEALRDIVLAATGTTITIYAQKIDGVQKLGDVVFVFAEGDEYRRAVWKKSLRNKIRTKLVIEARSSLKSLRVFSVVPTEFDQIKRYETTLNDDSECGALRGPVAELLSGCAVWQLIRWAAIKHGKQDALDAEIKVDLKDCQVSAFDQLSKGLRVDVVGAGATGSRIVASLARLGFTNIHVWDFDVVESHNIANQAYRNSDVGRLKVEALKELVAATTGIEIAVHNERVDGSQSLGDLVFILTDTMASRKEIWTKALREKAATSLVIETRMGTDSGRIYSVVPTQSDQISQYEGNFYEDVETEVSACGTSMSVGPTAEVVSGLAVWQMIRRIVEPQGTNQQDIEMLFGLRPMYTLGGGLNSDALK